MKFNETANSTFGSETVRSIVKWCLSLSDWHVGKQHGSVKDRAFLYFLDGALSPEYIGVGQTKLTISDINSVKIQNAL